MKMFKRNSYRALSLLLIVMLIAESIIPAFAYSGDDSYVEINKFTASVSAGATQNADGDYVWTANSSDSGHTFVYRVNYNLSGTYDFAPGEIEIRVPVRMLLNRDGAYSDVYETSVPEDDAEGLTEDNEFSYHVEGDEIVITNRVTMPAGTAGFIDTGYLTAEKTFEYADYGYAGGVHPKGGSDEFKASIRISQGSVTKKASAQAAPVYIDTAASVIRTELFQYEGLYSSWDHAWGPKPDDADDYYYLHWKVNSEIRKPTQPFYFTLDDVFDVEDGEVAGYQMHENGSQYTMNNTVYIDEYDESLHENELNMERTDYVITRHKKSTYDAIIEADILHDPRQYTVTDVVNAIVTPADQVDAPTKAVSSLNYTFEEPHFVYPSGHLYSYKEGRDAQDRWVLNSDYIRAYTLDLLQRGEADSGIESIDDIKYCAVAYGHLYPWTVGDSTGPDGTPDGIVDGFDYADPYAYGMVPMDVVMTDNKVYLLDDTEPLGKDDYEFGKIDLYLYTSKAVYDPDSMTYTIDPVSSRGGSVEITAERDCSGVFEKAADFDPVTNRFSNIDSSLVLKSSENTLFFRPGVTGYQVKTSSADYYLDVVANPYINLKRSADVLSEIDGLKKIKLKNSIETVFYSKSGDLSVGFAEGPEVASFKSSAFDYIIGMERKGHIGKRILSYSNDKVNRKLIANWTVNASEDYYDYDGSRKFVLQNGGTFYDLLPVGSSYLANSVKAYVDDIEQPYGSYRNFVVENYNDTGRTLLCVIFDVPGEKFSFEYGSVHSWDSLYDYGKLLLNSVAYESGNTSIGEGLPDTGGELTFKDIMFDLDLETDADRFLYSERLFEPTPVTSGSLGLYKRVKGSDSDYASTGYVYPDSDYSYKIRFATDTTEQAAELVAYDSLENYSVKAGKRAGAVSGWHGELRSVDLSSLRDMGMDPVVWYSTAEGLDIAANKELKAPTWVKASAYTGELSDVTAIAVDMRKAADGSDYVMPKGGSAVFTVFLRSPKTSDIPDPDNLYTYNNIYLDHVIINELNQRIGPELIHQDYTTLQYLIVADVAMTKVSTRDGITPVEGVTFKLTGTSDYGNAVDLTCVTNSSGSILFEHVEKGSYKLAETESTDDYLLNKGIWSVVIDNSGDVFINGEALTGDYTIENEPRIHGDISIIKKGYIDFSTAEKYLENAVFKLEGTSDYGNPVSMVAVSDGGGTVVFSNVEMGTYTLSEMGSADGYITSADTWKVICDATGLVYVAGAQTDITGRYELYNEPYHDLLIKKLDAEDTSMLLAGAEFTLKGTSDTGALVDMTAVSSDTGTVAFEDIESGTYILRETKAPDNYLLDDSMHIITVHPDGTVDGLEPFGKYYSGKGYEAYYAFLNERSYEGVITVTKVWDDADAADRPIPVMVISTEAPEFSFDDPTIVAAKWKKVSMNNVVGFSKADISSEAELPSGAVRVDDEVSEHGVYLWVDADKAYWWSAADKVYLPSDSSRLFYNCRYMTSIDLAGLDSSRVTNFEYMFDYCQKLKTLDLSGFDTSNAKSMSYMFSSCSELVNLNLSSFDTSQVEYMYGMFGSCSKLESLDLSHFKTPKLLGLSKLFSGCKALKTLDVSNFDTSNVNSMEYLFWNAESITDDVVEHVLSAFDTSKATGLNDMFGGCKSLVRPDLSGLEVDSCETLLYFISDCPNLETIDLGMPELPSTVKTMQRMFSGDTGLKEADMSIYNTSGVTVFSEIFSGCTGLEKASFAGCNMSLATDMSGMFYGCTNLRSIDFTGCRSEVVESMERIFCLTQSLEELLMDENSFSGENFTNIRCAIGYYDTGHGNYTTTDDVINAFMRGTDTSHVTDMSHLFTDMCALENPDFSLLETQSATDMSYMFVETQFKSLDLRGWDVSNVTNISHMFYRAYSLESLNLTGWDTRKVTNMSGLFGHILCKEVDLSSFATPSLTKLDGMFYMCDTQTVYVSDKWDISHLPDMSQGGFWGTFYLVGEKGTTYDNYHCSVAYARIDGGPDAPGFFTYKEYSGPDIDEPIPESLSYSLWGDRSVYDVLAEMGVRAGNAEAFLRSDTAPAAGVDYIYVNDPESAKSISLWYDSPAAVIYWYCEDEKVFLNPDSSELFASLNNAEVIDLSSFDTSLVTNMSCMFHNCYEITTLDLSGFDTSKVTDMSYMFDWCESIEELDLSTFDTSEVTNMECMFDGLGYYSENFKVLDLSSFDTSKVTDMNCMLSEMNYVEEIKFGTGFDTGAVTDMEFMFAYDYALKTLDLTGFNTQNVEDMRRMFDCCENLTSLDISSFDTSNVTDFYCFLDCTYLLSDLKINPLTFTTAKAENLGYMFSDCDALTEDDLAFVKDFDLSSCTSILGMFCGSEAIEELDLTSWDVSNVESFSSLFSGCKNLRSVDMSGWDTSALLNLSNMFSNCPKLEELDLSSISTAGVRYFDSMFSGCTGLESLDLSSFDTSNATSMYNMFSGCTGLESLDLSSFDVSGLTNMQYIFRNCSALTELDLSGWAPVSVTQITDAFSGCTSLKTIYASSAWKLSVLSSDAVMFTGDTALVGGNGTAFDASKADSSMARIDKAAAPGYFTLVRDPNTLEYRSVSTMFGGAASDSADAYEQWIDNGDGTWTYRFKIMDEDNLYYGWEESAPGYTWTVDETSPAAIDYKAGDRDKGFEVVNTKRSDMTTGMLQISKRVDGALAYGDTDRYFHFEVSIPGLADGSYGDLIFADGKARLQLKGGEIALAEDIPAGLGYTVAEIGADGFDVTSAGESGSIESGKLAKAAFTNTRPDLTGSLAIEKKLVSGSSDQSFVIAVKLTGPQIGGVQVFGDYVFKDGYAKLSVNAGERVLLSGIPENTSYQTAEDAAAGFILESAENASGAITKGKTAEVVYTNKKQEQITGGFTLEKVVVGSAASDSFEFIAAFEGLIPGAGYSFSDGTSFTAGAAGTATAVLHLCGGESVSIEGLPVGAFYTIVEKASDYRASYTISDAGDLGLISRAQGANTAIGADLSTEKEEVNKGESITVTFENRTQLFRAAFAKEAQPGEFLDGAVLQIWSGSSLIYEWTSSSDAMEVLELAAGSYRLVEKTSPEGYKKADDIEFEISNDGEILIGGAGADFVTMTDKPLSVEIRKLNQDGETVTGASIAVYRGEDVSPEGEISDSAVPVHTFISKESPETLTGRLAAGREYVLVELAAPAGYGISEPVRFTVSGNDETTKVSMTDPRAFYVPFGKYDEAGSFLAGASLQILKAGSRDVVREWTSSDRESSFGLAAGDYIFHEAATPDDSLYMLAEDIAFSVGADGKILCGGEEITGLSMTDALIPLLSASVEIKAQKIVNGKPAQGSGYSFVLKKDGAEIQRVSNTDIDISFAKITYTAPGTYEYTVSEIPGSDTGTVYDASVYDVKVVVSEGFELSMEITRGGEPVNGMPVFSNITRSDPKPPVEPGDPEETYTLTYHVAGDDRYGVPSDSRTPSAVDGIELGGSVDPLAGGPVTRWTTSDGTPEGIPGSWSFSEHWTLKSSDPGAADITSDKITGIRSDKDVYGKWVFTPDAQPGPGGENLPGTDPDPGTVPDPGTTPDPGSEPDPGDTGLGGPDGPGSGHGTEGDDIGEETPEDPWMPRTGDSDITLYTWLMIVSLACMLWLKRLSRG